MCHGFCCRALPALCGTWHFVRTAPTRCCCCSSSLQRAIEASIGANHDRCGTNFRVPQNYKYRSSTMHVLETWSALNPWVQDRITDCNIVFFWELINRDSFCAPKLVESASLAFPYRVAQVSCFLFGGAWKLNSISDLIISYRWKSQLCYQ